MRKNYKTTPKQNTYTTKNTKKNKYILKLSSNKKRVDLLKVECCYPFWLLTQKREKRKKIKKQLSEENKKIYIAMSRGHRDTQKMTKDWLRKFKNTRIEI